MLALENPFPWLHMKFRNRWVYKQITGRACKVEIWYTRPVNTMGLATSLPLHQLNDSFGLSLMV